MSKILLAFKIQHQVCTLKMKLYLISFCHELVNKCILIFILKEKKLKQYQRRLNATVKPKVYGKPNKEGLVIWLFQKLTVGKKRRRRRLTKEERLRLANKRDRQRPYVLAGLCLFFILVAIITPIAITFGTKSTKKTRFMENDADNNSSSSNIL